MSDPRQRSWILEPGRATQQIIFLPSREYVVHPRLMRRQLAAPEVNKGPGSAGNAIGAGTKR